MKCPLLVVIYVVDLILKESQVAADLALRFAMNCSHRVVSQVHAAFNMTEESADLEAFSMCTLQFYLKFFDHSETSLDEYPALKQQSSRAMQL